MLRTILAAVVGGVLLFIWGAVAHGVLKIDAWSVRPLANEAAVLENLAANVPETGVYFVPGMDMRASPTPEQAAAWGARMRQGPAAMLVVHPHGRDPAMGPMLGIELLSNLLAALVAALALARWLPAGYLARVGAFFAFGVVAWLSVTVSQWDWYGFTTPFLLGDLVDQAGGWLLAGLGMAAILKPRAA